MRASWAAGPTEHEAWRAAHGGTTVRPTDGEGLGDGLGTAEGDSLGVSAGDWVANADGDGLRWVLAPAAFEQPATAKIAMAAASLIPTGNWNGGGHTDVTAGERGVTASTISPPVHGLNEQRVNELKAALAVALFVLCACLDTPAPLTATVNASASQSSTVGGRAQLVVSVINTGPPIPHLGLMFLSADKWFERHAVTEPGGCTIDTDHSAFDCGDLAAGATATFSFAGTTLQAGTFHYELALRELVRPFNYVNDHPDGADVQTWDENVAAS